MVRFEERRCLRHTQNWAKLARLQRSRLEVSLCFARPTPQLRFAQLCQCWYMWFLGPHLMRTLAFSNRGVGAAQKGGR